MILVYALVGAHSAYLLLACCRVQTITAEQECRPLLQSRSADHYCRAGGRSVLAGDHIMKRPCGQWAEAL